MPEFSESELARFAKVPLDVEVELDRRTVRLREIFDLSVGSVLAMKKRGGDNFDVLIGGVRLGSGEAVLMGDMAAVRLTSIEGEK